MLCACVRACVRASADGDGEEEDAELKVALAASLHTAAQEQVQRICDQVQRTRCGIPCEGWDYWGARSLFTVHSSARDSRMVTPWAVMPCKPSCAARRRQRGRHTRGQKQRL